MKHSDLYSPSPASKCHHIHLLPLLQRALILSEVPKSLRGPQISQILLLKPLSKTQAQPREAT